MQAAAVNRAEVWCLPLPYVYIHCIYVYIYLIEAHSNSYFCSHYVFSINLRSSRCICVCICVRVGSCSPQGYHCLPDENWLIVNQLTSIGIGMCRITNWLTICKRIFIYTLYICVCVSAHNHMLPLASAVPGVHILSS